VNDRISKRDASVPLSPLELALAKRRGTGTNSILILDTSSSMADVVMNGSERIRKIDMLSNVVSTLRSDGAQFRQIVFSDYADFNDVIPQPSGGTNMAEAFRLAGEGKPKQIVLVSDGEPNNAEEAMQAAKHHLTGVIIDTFYVGEYGGRGEAFLQQLSKLYSGSHGVSTRMGELTSGIRLALNAGSAADIAKGPIAL
jgi:uncharacterized protein with von Willebrand factor type A (vWA) domain